MSFDLQQIKTQLLADKKKLGILTMLVLVGLLLWGRLLMTDVPRPAVAKPTKAATAKAQLEEMQAEVNYRLAHAKLLAAIGQP